MEKVRAWAATAARRDAIDLARKKKTRAEKLEEYKASAIALNPHTPPTQLQNILNKEFWDAVYQCAREAPFRTAQVIIARFIWGWSTSETAAKLGTSSNAVNKAVQRALPRLEAALAPWAGADAFRMLRGMLDERPSGMTAGSLHNDWQVADAKPPLEAQLHPPVARVVESREDYDLAQLQAAKYRMKVRPVAGTAMPRDTAPDDDLRDEALTIPQIEAAWRGFCASIGLTDVPDIRPALMEHAKRRAERNRASPWWLEPFSALQRFLKGAP